MGHREMKRVPLDFDWPVDKVWDGYLNLNRYPPEKCKPCDGSGQNPETKQIDDDYYDFADTGRKWVYNITQDEVQALVDKDRLMDLTHTWTPKDRWKRREDGYIPTAEEVNEWAQRPGLTGHDAINSWILIETRAKRLGVWGNCKRCGGEGETFQNATLRQIWKNWEPTEPPTGDGYQLWETVSEGSPQSPVFATAEELAEWCETNATIFADHKTSKEKWLKMFKEDGVDYGSMLVFSDGYFGPAVDMPEVKEDK